MTKFFEKPTQVKFLDRSHNMWVGGIACHDEIICGCCGCIFKIDEFADHEIVTYDWMDINEEIIGED